MESSSKLTPDVLGYILDCVDPENLHVAGNWGRSQAHETLSALSLTCKLMVPIAQRHLFSTITFHGYWDVTWQDGRSKFLLSHPAITARYVKNLVIDIRHKFSTWDYDLLQKMCESSSLTFIQLSSSGDWNKLPEKTKTSILHLFQIPTLRHLTLERITNLPVVALRLLNCRGLTNLALHDVYLAVTPAGAGNIVQSLKLTSFTSSSNAVHYNGTLAALMKPVGENQTGASDSIVSFDHVRDASFNVGNYAELPHICKILKRATCLERLQIQVPQFLDGCWLAGIGASLAANPQPKLRYVKIDLGSLVDEDGDRILSRFNHELEQLSNEKNVLESLELKMGVLLDTLSCPDWTVWAADLDKILADNSGFPALRKVTIDLTWLVPEDCSPDYGVYNDPWKLADTQFPRLLESTAIGFVFSEDCQW